MKRLGDIPANYMRKNLHCWGKEGGTDTLLTQSPCDKLVSEGKRENRE